ncbi:MAG: M48 family metallopeptidase [Bacteroidota bacterium]
MNIYAVIILSTLVISNLLDLIANFLNLSTVNDPLPEEFAGIFDEKSYRKSQEYTRTTSVFGMVTSEFDLAVTLLFWFLGGFNYLDTIVRGWNLNMILIGVLYIGILVLFRSLLSLPFSLYSTFVIEERFGFNKTTVKTFITDLLKGLFLSIVLGGPILAGVIAIFMYAGNLAWLYCWIVVSVISLFIQFIAPTWIMPLFNKFTPLVEGELLDAILSYAQSVSFPLKGIFVMDGSKRSSKTNAFFTGFGKNKRIALFDTLIGNHTTDELVAVLAHEIGHYKKKHIMQSIIMSIAHLGFMFYLLSIFVSHEGLFHAFYMSSMSIYAGLLFFGMLYSPVEEILSIVLQMISRKHEFEADRYAVETTRSQQWMIAALKKLSRENLSHLTPHRFYVLLNYSHPPVLERIRAIKNIDIL